jgi:hypothetical protein
MIQMNSFKITQNNIIILHNFDMKINILQIEMHLSIWYERWQQL